MNHVWFERLEEVIKADPRSLAEISRAAGFGQNFVQQLLRDRKEPGAGKVFAVLRVLGEGQTLYVFTGLNFGPEDKDIIKLFLQLDPALRAKAVELLRVLQSQPSS
jgi:transcriptional regulator with XRE-family HTH domain